MFAKKNRFSFRRGIPKQFVTSQFFALYYRQNNDILHCAVVVGKKVDKRAVERNRIKRLVVKNVKEILDSSTPYEIALYVRADFKKLLENDIKAELLKIFEKAKIIWI